MLESNKQAGRHSIQRLRVALRVVIRISWRNPLPEEMAYQRCLPRLFEKIIHPWTVLPCKNVLCAFVGYKSLSLVLFCCRIARNNSWRRWLRVTPCWKANWPGCATSTASDPGNAFAERTGTFSRLTRIKQASSLHEKPLIGLRS